MNNQPYSGAERHVDKGPHSGVETSLSSRVSAPTSRPTHIYAQPSPHHTTDHINTYTKPATSLSTSTHSSLSNVSNIIPATVRPVDGRIGRALGKMPSVTICNNVDAMKSCNTLSSSGASNLHVPFPPQTSVLQLATTTVPTMVETSSTNPSMSLAANSPAFRGGGVGGGGVVSACGQSTPAGHHIPTFTSHLPRGAAAASALSVPKPGSSMSASAAAAVMRPNQPSPILSNTSVYSQMNRASLISTIKPTAPTVAGPRANQPNMTGPAPTSQIILRSEKPRMEKQSKKPNLVFRHNMPVYSDSAAVVTSAQTTNSNIHITLKKRNTTDTTKSQVMFSHGQSKALPINPSISHSSPTTATAVASKMISQASLTPLAQNIAIKTGGNKWGSVNHLVDLTKEASKSMATKTLAAISISNQPAATSSNSITQAAAVSTTATTSIPSSIPIAKVTPQRQQASSHSITQAAAAAAAAAVHPLNQETRSDGQSHGQPTQTAATSNYFIPAQAPRVSTGCTSLATSGNSNVTHSDNRQEGRATVVPHMPQYMQPELIYKMSYPVYPMTHATVRPSIISSNTSNYSNALPTAGGHCMNLAQNTSTMHVNTVNSMLVAVDPLRGSFPVTSQYTPAHSVSTTMTAANTTSPVVTATPETEIVSCSTPTPVSILSGAALLQQAPSSLPNNTNTPNINNSSPRPSILRKRTNDGAAVNVKKSFGLHSSSSTENTQSPRQDSIPQSNISSPKTPAGDNSQSSTDTALSTEAGSTITPTSIGDCRNQSDCLETHEQNGVVPSSLLSASILPNLLQNNVEASPRKKPRKQMLNANEELKDNTSTDDEYDKLDKMEESKEYKSRDIKPEVKDEYTDEEGVRWTTEKRRPNLSLINFYSMSWKVRNNHFQRHSDVKSKEDRRSSVNELSNQRGVVQKVSGWKLYFLATQLEDMNDMEKVICSQMCKLQETIAPKASKHGTHDSDEVRLHELTQANIQRCKLVIDQLSEAHDSMLKILDHKDHILEIINKHISKRPIKKKERT